MTVPNCDDQTCKNLARYELRWLYYDDDDRRWSDMRCCAQHLIEFVDREVKPLAARLPGGQ